MQKVSIGLIQTSVSEDLNQNLKRTIKKVEDALFQGASIICLQELYRSVYFPQQERIDASCFAEIIPGESTETFSALAKKYDAVILIPIFEKAGDKYYNSVAVVNSDGELLPIYRKTHIPHDPLFYEKNYFEEGNIGFKVYETKYGKIAPLICYDQWFPEAARVVTLMGADIIFYPTAIGWIAGEENPSEGDWHDAWETVMRGHAIANGVHVAAVNRVGQEGSLRFWGSSFVCDSFGKVLARAGSSAEEALVVEVDLDMNREVRAGWGFLRNRRPQTYRLITQSINLTPREACLIPVRPENPPSKLGYHMPAEWEKHDAVWLSWPYDIGSFPELEAVEKTYVAIIQAIHRSERVDLQVTGQRMKDKVKGMLSNSGVNLSKVTIHAADYADVWFRDYGPTFLVNKNSKLLAMIHWIFNAWGEKYDELMKDTYVPDQMNEYMKLPIFEPGIVMEGGSIEVNGAGTVMVTEQCLLNRNRNSHLSKAEIEGYLKDYLGVRKVIWLKEGILGDDTDGHVDDIARFVNPATVVCAFEEDEADPNYPILKENYDILTSSSDQDGHPLTIIKIPMPGFVGQGKRLPASYANFYIGNKVVLVPVFGHENDGKALKIIQGLFPGRKAVGIYCRELVHGLGTLHCISQQQPALNP